MAKKTRVVSAVASAEGETPVSYIKHEVDTLLEKYSLIEDCIGGQFAVKLGGEKYLPTPDAYKMLGPGRYAAYLRRAVFYSVAERTLDGMVGEVFAVEPEVDTPDALKILIDDVTGGGLSMAQMAKQIVRELLAFGRGGLFADYPKTGQAATKLQLQTGEIRPTLLFYRSIDCINWRTFRRGSRTLLSLVVLRETINIDVGQFGERTDVQYRVLMLDDAEEYIQQVWTDPSGGNSQYSISETIKPVGFDSKPFNEIPFTFVGAKDNDATIDSPPLYGLCELNMAHYRNSADFEDSVFVFGQPIPWFSGLSTDYINAVYPDKIVGIGSNGSIMLPEHGSAGLLQASPNTLAKDAMTEKERQMVALGARLVQQQVVQRTATEAGLETASEMSVLSSVAKNASTALKWGLEWANWLLTGQEVECKYNLNSEYDLAQGTPDECRAAIEAWQKQAITFEEMREVLRKANMATIDDATAEQDIADDVQNAVNLNPLLGNTPPGDTIGGGNNGGLNNGQALQ